MRVLGLRDTQRALYVWGRVVNYLIRRQGTVGNSEWMELTLISDDQTETIRFAPALLGGWRAVNRYVQGHDDWCGYSAASILAFKRESAAADFELIADPEAHDAFIRSRERLCAEAVAS